MKDDEEEETKDESKAEDDKDEPPPLEDVDEDGPPPLDDVAEDHSGNILDLLKKDGDAEYDSDVIFPPCFVPPADQQEDTDYDPSKHVDDEEKSEGEDSDSDDDEGTTHLFLNRLSLAFFLTSFLIVQKQTSMSWIARFPSTRLKRCKPFSELSKNLERLCHLQLVPRPLHRSFPPHIPLR